VLQPRSELGTIYYGLWTKAKDNSTANSSNDGAMSGTPTRGMFVRGSNVAGFNNGVRPSSSLPCLPSSPVPSLPFHSLPSPFSYPYCPLVPFLNPARSLGERCKLPSRSGCGRAHNAFWCILRKKNTFTIYGIKHINLYSP